MIITPDHPDFYPILHSTLPFGWCERIDSNFSGTFIVRAETGLLEPATTEDLQEYLWDGEYDEVVRDDNFIYA